ncbi:hypothetical protein FNV43_RR24279 [Rhamnella rubrinervis]|uniref:Probable quinone oxidoreductase n=1 Tax=Rhamnella rubrinervis TaxID=2594499 RepID=A0A8K0DXT1_9ROSA|nr:hypothetical protein FNV43_RR24279 [Rhamnella rubrinervis]
MASSSLQFSMFGLSNFQFIVAAAVVLVCYVEVCSGFNPKHLNLSTMANHWSSAGATWYGSPDGAGSDGGSCGYGGLVSQPPFSSMVTGIGPSLYKSGKECGACYQVKCTNHPSCSGKPATVVITDFCPGGPCASGSAHFDLSGTAFGSMAIPGEEKKLRDAGVLEIRYARVACDYSGKTIAFHVDKGSNPNYFATVIEFEEGDGDLAGVELKEASSEEWCAMQQSWGAVWKLDAGSQLQPPLSIKLISQYSQQSLVAKNVIPDGWKPDATYRSLVLKWEDVEIGEPNEGEIRVRNKAIGLNFFDVRFCKGLSYKPAVFPFTPGIEAVGVVTAVGPGLTGRQVGDIVAYVELDVVAYAASPMGSYTEEQILPANKVVPVPSSIDPVIAASVILKGMTAQFLLHRVFKVEAGHTVLIHAAAGGVGSLLCQWANALGATVIGTVSTKEKAAQAKEDGARHVINYMEEDFAARVNEITSGNGVDVVYDSVGKDTFQGSLACLKLRGYMVSFGVSSGEPDPVPLSALAVKSLFLTWAGLMHYTTTQDEILETAGEVFANVASGLLRVRVNQTYPLSQAAQAHVDLEARKTSGSVVLIP